MNPSAAQRDRRSFPDLRSHAGRPRILLLRTVCQDVGDETLVPQLWHGSGAAKVDEQGPQANSELPVDHLHQSAAPGPRAGASRSLMSEHDIEHP